MFKKKIIIISILLCLVTFSVTVPPSRALTFKSLAKIVIVIKKIADYIKNINKVTRAIDTLPHKFPFGGHILSSERACSLKFRTWVWTYPFGVPVPIVCPSCIPIPLGGRAIEVGPPVPSPGKIITFPFISDIYKNYQEDRVGPWALGLGFSPFPLDEINKTISSIDIAFPPSLVDCPGVPYDTVFCLDDFHFDCTASGEKDSFGNDIYKVILKLGTSPD